ncbi:DUF3558 domain-containing protein [Rhodococcus sp. MALMAid1271]|uniref:DUF3558 domain-containing protein n=1 Tax=Rhodococcus sp. MALMAid1271 TaxID=3411744 RepID=UPI003BA3A223
MRVVRGGLRAVACASALLLAGCGSSTQGSPVTGESPAMVTTTAASEPGEPFDPCTIPKDAVTASGLDVSTERADFAGITTYPGWKGCTWDASGANAWYYLSVLSSINSIDEYLRSPQNQRQVPVKVGSRDAVQYNADYQGDPPTGCDIVLDASGNLIILVVDTIGSEDTLGDPCLEVRKHATDLVGYLPSE